ncbi:Uncharacterised protein [Klebsiella aerogenes]|nr:Uncharacterised protein [Klebsiella aerogenes]
MFLLLVDSKSRNDRRMAKSENHHGNGDPDLMERVRAELHLAGEVLRMPVAD